MRFSEQFKMDIDSCWVVFRRVGLYRHLLPLLPTTPFLLLAAARYIRSSEHFYHWLIHHRWFGNYIRNLPLAKAAAFPSSPKSRR